MAKLTGATPPTFTHKDDFEDDTEEKEWEDDDKPNKVSLFIAGGIGVGLIVAVLLFAFVFSPNTNAPILVDITNEPITVRAGESKTETFTLTVKEDLQNKYTYVALPDDMSSYVNGLLYEGDPKLTMLFQTKEMSEGTEPEPMVPGPSIRSPRAGNAMTVDMTISTSTDTPAKEETKIDVPVGALNLETQEVEEIMQIPVKIEVTRENEEDTSNDDSNASYEDPEDIEAAIATNGTAENLGVTASIDNPAPTFSIGGPFEITLTIETGPDYALDTNTLEASSIDTVIENALGVSTVLRDTLEPCEATVLEGDAEVERTNLSGVQFTNVGPNQKMQVVMRGTIADNATPSEYNDENFQIEGVWPMGINASVAYPIIEIPFTPTIESATTKPVSPTSEASPVSLTFDTDRIDVSENTTDVNMRLEVKRELPENTKLIYAKSPVDTINDTFYDYNPSAGVTTTLEEVVSENREGGEKDKGACSITHPKPGDFVEVHYALATQESTEEYRSTALSFPVMCVSEDGTETQIGSAPIYVSVEGLESTEPTDLDDLYAALDAEAEMREKS